MKKVFKILFIICIFVIVPKSVFADMGPKPSITIKLKNIESKNYMIDLLTDLSDKEYLIDEVASEYFNNYKKQPIYNYHEGNWYATSIRDKLLFGDITATKDYTHIFSYFGVPNEFKVIIQLDDGSLRVSKLLTRKDFNYTVTLDVNSMDVISDYTSLTYKVFSLIKVILITLIVELLVAILFKIKQYNIIVFSNIFTNLILQLAIINNIYILNNIKLFVLLEIVVCILEFLIYLKFIKNINYKKLFIYTFIANFITAFLTFLI